MKLNINQIKEKGKIFKCIYYATVIFYNDIVGKIPSRHIRRWFCRLLGVSIDKSSIIYRSTELIYPYGIEIGEDTAVGGRCLLDARGGIKIGKHVNISSYVKLITGSHDVKSSEFEASFLPIEIDDYAWIGTGATILQNVIIGKGAVVASGAIVTKNIPPYEVWGGVPANFISKRNDNLKYIVKAIGLNTFLH